MYYKSEYDNLSSTFTLRGIIERYIKQEFDALDSKVKNDIKKSKNPDINYVKIQNIIQTKKYVECTNFLESVKTILNQTEVSESDFITNLAESLNQLFKRLHTTVHSFRLYDYISKNIFKFPMEEVVGKRLLCLSEREATDVKESFFFLPKIFQTKFQPVRYE